jgi:carbon-monoxide dehydrogenase small subunit
LPKTHELTLTVNGAEVTQTIPARMTLADFLREELDLTATHLGCEHGVCGACTIMVDGRTARSCTLLAAQVHGALVTTVEALSPDGELTSVQRGFWHRHGMQCGFCTPGFLMTVTELLHEHPHPTDDEVEQALGGNLCRCTGYTKILEAVREAEQLTAAANGEEGWTPGPGTTQPDINGQAGA